MRIMLIEDDEIMAQCIERAVKKVSVASVDVLTCNNAISAMQQLDDYQPDLICLDILLNGPDGFSFLNELRSYDDLSTIPIVIITSLDLHLQDLSHYGVKKIIYKETMTPPEITATIHEVIQHA